MMMDAVITWVNGQDPAHISARLRAAGQTRPDISATEDTRFHDTGEIYYCIASILKYAPFIRRIFIVTDNQTPRFLQDFNAQNICPPDKISLVSHRDIFQNYEHALPTFNSLTIETMLWHIPDLSEHVLYFNDDVFLNAPVCFEDFFTSDHKMRVFGTRYSRRFYEYKLVLEGWIERLKGRHTRRPSFRGSQMIAARLAGLEYFIQFEHTPHSFRRSSFESYFTARDDILKQQISHQFRHADQFSALGLCHHLELAQGTAIAEPARPSVYITPRKLTNKQLHDLTQEHIKFACVQSLDTFSKRDADRVLNTLHRKFKNFLPSTISAHQPSF